jgi:curved DNA-binding protein
VEFKDYYKILGVPRTATAKEIKAAYRRLARKHHPDVNKGNPAAEARFKEINEANAVLSDPGKRRQYDALGPDWQNVVRRGGGGRSGQGFPVDLGDDLGGFSDFFRTIFGGGGFDRGGPGGFGGGVEDLFERRPPPRGRDLEGVAELTLEEVLHGTTRTVQLDEGGGTRRVEVKIPPGIEDGARVRVRGEGGRGPGGAGDLFLRVHVLPHPRFTRDGDDLRTSVAVPLTTAVLGGEGAVPNLEGERGIKIPEGSRPGRIFRLRGLGLPRRQAPGERGDLFAVLAVELPDGLSARARELFEGLRELGL